MIISRRHAVRFLLTAPLAAGALPSLAQAGRVIVDVPAVFGKSPAPLFRKFGKPVVDPEYPETQVFKKPGIEITVTVLKGKVREMEISLDKSTLTTSQRWLRQSFNLRLPPSEDGPNDTGHTYGVWHKPSRYPAIKQVRIQGGRSGWGLLRVFDKDESLAG